MSILDKLKKLAHEEESFLGSEFLAPRLRGQNVRVRLGGVVCELSIANAGYQGFGIFKVLSYRKAALVRDATEAEREKYLELFPAIRLLVSCREGGVFGVLANRGDSRVSLVGEAEIQLPGECELFDTVIARFDGQQLWFDRVDYTSAKIAEKMRQLLAELNDSAAIPGTSTIEQELYLSSLARRKLMLEQEKLASTEGRLNAAVRHAGGSLQSYIERADGFTLTFSVDGTNHTSVVDRNMQVRAAGVCLSGQDKQFDLASLVSVLREGQRTNRIHRVGINTGHGGDEDNY